MAITDNSGYFRFLTVFPGYYNNRAPHLHVRIEHRTYGTIETEIFFENHPRNAKDPKYKKLTKNQQKTVTAKVFFVDRLNKDAGKKARFDVTYNATQVLKDL